MLYHLIVTIPMYLLLCAGLAGVFKKAGKDSWKAFVPFLNVWEWIQLVDRKKYWMVFMCIPVINLIFLISLCLDTVKSFGKEGYGQHVLAVLFPWAYFLYLGYNKEQKWIGTDWKEEERAEQEKTKLKKKKKPKKSEGREWADAILYAGTAALIIRTFLLESFMIPTTSMEGTLLAGDFLFVSKFHYGTRMPMVPASVPFIHNTLPGTQTKSYLPQPYLPYSRLPGLKDVERNDIVVFNYPANDVIEDIGQDFLVPEISMKQNYIKRCVGIPGDELEVRSGTLYVNGEEAWKADHLQYSYQVYTKDYLNKKTLEENGFRADNTQNANYFQFKNDIAEIQADEEMLKFIKTMPQVVNVKPDFRPSDYQAVGPAAAFPDKYNYELNYGYKNFNWNRDDFGPLKLPSKGMTIELTEQNIAKYRRLIEGYEHNDWEEKGGEVYLNGEAVKEYTFKLGYYWMMGDNRHASYDSRYWGPVPEDHIVGRPWVVAASFEGGIRWDRLFKPVSSFEP